MAREAPLDERLVIGTGEEARRDTAAVCDVERLSIERQVDGQRRRRLADGGRGGTAVLRDRGRDVGRALEAALDLETRDTGLGERGHDVEPDEILRRQQVLDLAEVAHGAVEDERVGQAARLRALAAVRRAPTPRLRRQALATPRDTQRAVHEDLELDRSARPVAADLVDGELARHDDARQPELAEQADRERARRGHLGRRVDLERGTDRTREQRDGGILDDDRVDPGGGDAPDQLLDDRELGLEHERVERDVRAGPGAVNPRDDLGERRRWEVLGTRARVESVVETEVDSVGAGSERRGQRVAVTGGRQNFGAAHRGRKPFGQRSIPRSGREGSTKRTTCLPFTLALPNGCSL